MLAMMLMMMLPAFGQEECESDPGFPFPQVCCDPPVIDVCAKQTVPSDMGGVYWISGHGQYDDKFGWKDEGPTFSDDYPPNGRFRPTSFGASKDHSSNSDVTCALTKVEGEIWCWGDVDGSSQISGRPTGGEPYSSLDAGNFSVGGSTGIWVALDSTGTVKKWGKTNTAFDGGLPTASGFESVSIGGGPVGCAVDTAVAGVTCWGNDTQTIVSGRPTTGNYSQVALSQFNALAITTAGVPVMWGSSQAQYADFRTELASAASAVASPIVEAHLHESGKFAVLWHEDRTLTIVEEGLGQDESIAYAPCGSGSCPGGTVDQYHTDVEFRTAPRINENKAAPIICGVVADDPGDVYTCGEVICWGEALHDAGSPKSVHKCTQDEQEICQQSP